MDSTPVTPVPHRDLTVLHGKFSAFLAWSQPFIHRLIQGLSEHVECAVLCNETENLDRFWVPNIQRIERPAVRDPVRCVLAARRLRDRFDPDLLHAHFGWSAIRMLLLRQFLRVPLVTTFGGRDAFVQMDIPQFRDAYRLVLDVSDALVCVSDHLRRKLVEVGAEPERVCVIRRGTDLDRFRFVDRSDRSGPGPLQVLMVGRLVGKKGHRDALAALQRVRSEGHEVRLTVVGEGEEYADLRRLRRELGLREAVAFEPPTDHAGVRRRMAEADVFLHCSVTGPDGDTEGIPNVVVEAAATGLPVLGTEHGGITETIRHGVTGFLVKERDVEGIAAGLRALADREVRLEMGRAARNLAEAEFDFARQIDSHVRLYRELTDAWRREPGRRFARPLPEDAGAILRRAIEATATAEFSISEMFTELVARDDVLRPGLRDRPGLFSRAYQLKRHVPQSLKFPAKLALRRVLDRFLTLRYRRAEGPREPGAPELERLVMRYFRSGGELEALIASDEVGTLGSARQLLAARLRNAPPG